MGRGSTHGVIGGLANPLLELSVLPATTPPGLLLLVFAAVRSVPPRVANAAAPPAAVVILRRSRLLNMRICNTLLFVG
jgi:hypothetical protein